MKYDPSKIRNYYFTFLKSVKFFYGILIFSTFFTIIVSGIFHNIQDPIFWIFSVIILTFSTLQAVIFWRLTKTQIDLNKVIFGISNKVFPPKMPTLKDSQHLKSGFSEILKFIYTLDSSKEKVSTEITQTFPEILNNSKIALNILDSNNNIVFKNTKSLDFSKIQKNRLKEITKWIDEARELKIRDSKIWERVAIDSETNSEKQLFDIAVLFDKQFENDTVIYLINKTRNYANDENDLNFIAFAAHEIRGPITIIRGYLDILTTELQAMLNPEQKNYLLG